jgi:hypothetical protein
MAAVKKNMPNHVWGLVAESFGVVVKSFTEKADCDIFEHKNEQGEVDGEVLFNFKVEGSLTGATTGNPSLNVGDALTCSNAFAGLGGVAGGTNTIRSVELTRENENVREMTVTFIRRPTLTIA